MCLFSTLALAQSDDCANAPLIGPGTYAADGPFTGNGNTQADADNADWYVFDPSQSGYITISSCGNGVVDTRVNVHSGSCGSLVLLGQDDDGCPLGYPPGNSLLPNIEVVPGISYYIEWDDRWSGLNFDWELLFHTCPVPLPPSIVATDTTLEVSWTVNAPGATFSVELVPAGDPQGSGTTVSGIVGVDGPPVLFSGLGPGEAYDVYLTQSCSGDPSPDLGPWPTGTTGNPLVANDDCTGAIPLVCGDTVQGSTAPALDDAVPGCGTSISAPGIWYSFVGIDGSATLSTCNSANFDTKINVYSGDCASLVCEGGNDDGPDCGLTSELTVVTSAGTDYFVLVQGYDGEQGEFTLALSCNTCVAPLNVSVSTGDTLALVNWTGGDPGSSFTIEYGADGFIPGSGTTIGGVVGTDGPPVLITGLPPNSELDIYLVHDCGNGDVSTVTGPVSFSTSADPLAANAFCATALPISCGTTVTGDTQAGLNAIAPTCASANVTSKGLWYAFTGTGTDVSLATCGQAGYDTKISVFSGGCNALVCEAGNDDAVGCGGNTSELLFFAENGVPYLVLVHGFNAAAGPFSLSMDCTPPCGNVPPNDDCDNSFAITPLPIGDCSAAVTASNVCAYSSPLPNPPCDPYANIADVWFVLNTGFDPDHTLEIDAVTADPIHVAIYEACGLLTYLDCFMDVTDPIPLNGLPLNTDLYIRVWNGGGTEAGSFTLCDQAPLSTAVMADRSESLLVFPIPASDRLHVQGIPQGTQNIELLDLEGRLVMEQRPGNGVLVMRVGDLPGGTYLLRAVGTSIRPVRVVIH
ncbi:MAG: T9SS type A sorting domain-containing protein [Flavobacteriales bacterium]|nr:T9SS type A sorting domain-containing protein [Flavobacteriales bacterium]